MKEEIRMFGHDENLHSCALMITFEVERKRRNIFFNPFPFTAIRVSVSLTLDFR